MALGGTIRGKKTTLRLPVEADLETYDRWMADMRVRRAHSVWHEPAMPATWKERFKEIAKEMQTVLWSIDAAERLIGFAVGRVWPMGNGFDVNHFVSDRYFVPQVEVSMRCAFSSTLSNPSINTRSDSGPTA